MTYTYPHEAVYPCIVAVATYCDEKLLDWAAYISEDSDDAEYVGKHGLKLPKNVAVYFFDHLPSNKYRR